MNRTKMLLGGISVDSWRSPVVSTCAFFAAIFAYSLIPSSAEAQQRVVIVGTGSTVPAPLYAAWSQEYTRLNSDIQIRYVPVGTEEGIKEVAHGSGDFAAGELPLTQKQSSEEGLLELPVAIIAIVPIYNVPHLTQELRLSGEVLAEIYLGAIKNWNSPQIAKINPGIDLPDLPIKVIQRPAGKGSNYIFSDFLSKSSPKFRAQVGASLSPKWPVGLSAERSADMADKVKAEPGAIGFVEYQYAAKNNIQHASVLNSAGKFVKASSRTLKAACESVDAGEARALSTSLINARGADSYPLTSFTWIYLPAKPSDATRAAAMGNFLNWIYGDGQKIVEDQGYSSLPPRLLSEAKKKAANLTSQP